MGHRFVPRMPERNRVKTNKESERLTEEEAERLFKELVARLDAEDSAAKSRK